MEGMTHEEFDRSLEAPVREPDEVEPAEPDPKNDPVDEPGPEPKEDQDE